MRSVFDNVKPYIAVAPVALASGAGTPIVIDTLGYNSLMIEAITGAATGTPDSYSVAVAVTECATSGGSYSAAISGLACTITGDNKQAQIQVEGLGTTRLRFLKITPTAAFVNGTSPKALTAIVALLGRPMRGPVGNSTTQS